MTRCNSLDVAVYRQRLESLAGVRERCASLDLASADVEQLQRTWLVLEVVNALEKDTSARLDLFATHDEE